MKLRNTIITVLIIIIVCCLLTLSLLNSRIHKNDFFTVGNTAGNLNNKGLFCEQNGEVYFSNPYDNGYLYSMKPNETGYKRITKISVQSINADKERIYYALSGQSTGSGLGYIRKATGMFSIKKNGSGSIAYTQDPVGILALCGNNLYYQHYTNPSGTDLDCITIGKKDNKKVVDNMVSPASVDAGYIYYAGDMEDMYLHALNTVDNSTTTLYERPMYSPIYQNGYVYYIDLTTNYELHRYSVTTGEDVTLTRDRVDMFNVYGSMIYYQRDSSSPDAALVRMTTDGSDNEVVASGIYCDINITSEYVYFHAFGSPVPVYHTPVYGTLAVRVFEPEVED